MQLLMKKFKVAHVGPKNYPPSHGGVEKMVYDVIENMPDVTSSVLVEWDQPELPNVKVLPRGIYKQLKYIKKYVRASKIDIIHFNKETFIPHALFFTFLLKKTVLTIHGCAWRIKRWAWYYRVMFYLLDLLACIFVRKVVFVGKVDYHHFSKIVFWRRLHYISNGVEESAFMASQDVNQCVYIGRISPEKNIKGLLSFFTNKEQHITLYGPFDKHTPSYQKEMLDIINSMKNVKYGGVLAYNEILSTLSKYNTFCNLSFSEGMPVSVLEAASVGLNLVLSDIKQHKALNFEDVLYVDPNNVNGDIDFKSNSKANKARAVKEFSLNQTAEKYYELYLTF